MNILLMGGTGNISADCAEAFLKRGHRVTVLTRGHAAVGPEYEAICADRADRDSLRRAIGARTFDVVVNFIGFDVPDLEMDVDVLEGRIRQYIFISSTTVYAKPHRILPLTEDAPRGNRFSDYARKKEACEVWLERCGREKGFPYTIVRPSHTYSRKWIPNVVASRGYTFAARLEAGRPVFVPDDGETLWTLTAASDFATGLAGLAGNPGAVGEAVQITSDERLTWNQIYAEVAEALGVRNPKIVKVPSEFACQQVPSLVRSLPGDKAEPGVFDGSKLRRLVPEFLCRKKFREGIRESVAWLRAHPEDQHLNPDVDATFDQVVKAWEERTRRAGHASGMKG